MLIKVILGNEDINLKTPNNIDNALFQQMEIFPLLEL